MSAGDFFESLHDIAAGKTPATDPQATKVEKGVQLRGREFNGAFYIRAEDVIGLLELNGVLPKATALLKRRTQT